MRPNHRMERAHAAIFMDTETDPRPLPDGGVSHVLRFGWACYERTRTGDTWTEEEWVRYTSLAEYWTWVMTKCRPHTRLYIFAHNQAFDAVVMHSFSELPKRGWRLTAAIIDSPPVILRWRRDTTTLEILDTLNWWRHSLAKLGRSVGLPKLTMPGADATEEAWDTYAKRDVEVIHRAMHAWWAFIKAHDLGGFAPTLASQAFRAFRHRFMDHSILLDDHTQALALARQGFYGGRVEAFRLGDIEGPIYHYDVNSMYPAVMASNVFPTVLRLHALHPTLAELTRWVNEYCVVAQVSLRTDRAVYPVRYKDRLLFPIGDIDTVLTTPELLDALAHREIVYCREAAVYDRAPIFQRFVTECYALRMEAKREGNAVQTWLIKILMNSLYGKFAQHGVKWDVIGQTGDLTPRSWIEIDVPSGKVRKLRQLGGALQERHEDGESRDSHPAIAAHVTAYARSHLHALLDKAGWENTYYVDTDSLFVNATGAARLGDVVHDDALGGLKSEGVHAHMSIYGAKDYALPGKVITKGVRGNATWIDDRTITHEEWSSLTGLLRRGSLDAPTTIPKTKTLRRVYEKRRVLDGGLTAPWAWNGREPGSRDFPAW